MSEMTDKEVGACIDAIDVVPKLPTYAERALRRLESELLRARAEEKRLREALDDVKRAVEGVET